MLIAIDEIVSVSPWATQRMETVTQPGFGVPGRKPTTTRQVMRGFNYGSRIETRSGGYFVNNCFEDLAVTLKDAGWADVLPLQSWVVSGDPATAPAAEPQPR